MDTENKDQQDAAASDTKRIVSGTVPFEMSFFDEKALKKMMKISWWERIKLFFHKKQYHHDKIENTLTTYKVMVGKIYILNIETVPPDHYNCRCATEYH